MGQMTVLFCFKGELFFQSLNHVSFHTPVSRCHLRLSRAAIVVSARGPFASKYRPFFFPLQCHVRVFVRPWRRCMDVNGMVEVRRIVFHDAVHRFRQEYDIGYRIEYDVAGDSVSKARVLFGALWRKKSLT